MKYNGPIDFVIPWVDGNDPDWRNERSKWCIENEGDHREIRFRDWDNLQYWFRGVEKFAPWVNRIHFITYGHLPPWLNVDHPKINIVRHTDYIRRNICQLLMLMLLNSTYIESKDWQIALFILTMIHLLLVR